MTPTAKARKSSRIADFDETGPEMRALKQKWFRKGAEAFKTLLVQESNRILEIVDKDHAVFSKGQADGIRWLRQSLEELLGIKFEA